MSQIDKQTLKMFKREVKDPKLQEWLKIQTQIESLRQQQQQLMGEFDRTQFLEDLGLSKPEADAIYSEMNEETA